MTAMLGAHDTRVQEVLAHFCDQPHHGFGATTEWCESRHDCTLVVTCPTCGRSFALDEEQYAALASWTAAHGDLLACGITPLDG